MAYLITDGLHGKIRNLAPLSLGNSPLSHSGYMAFGLSRFVLKPLIFNEFFQLHANSKFRITNVFGVRSPESSNDIKSGFWIASDTLNF